MFGDASGANRRRQESFAKETRGVCVHHLVETQAALTPQAIALTFEGKSLSYAELNHQADRLANYLRLHGVGPNTLVGHFIDRGLEMVIGLLAILKAGGAYVPLDQAYPKDRLRFMLQDSGAGFLLSQKQLADAIPEFSGKLVLVDNRGRITDCPWVPAERKPRASDLAYVIYTSGSTGRPKGVPIPHHAFVNLLTSMRRRPGLSDRDVFLAITTLSFDIAGLELLLPLTVGARSVIVSREIATDGVKLAAYLSASEATVMQATPTTWDMVLDAGWEGRDSFKVLCGGEAMTRDLADSLLSVCDSVWNLYGPTETTIWSAVERVGRSPGPVFLGRPIDHTQLYILDADMKSPPPGREGELYIGGAGLARGYCNRPKLTEEKFVPNPFGDRPTSRLFRTGDLARQHPGGRIEWMGRVDHQVKIRGFRIELGEIDAILSRHPAVRRALTLAHEDESGKLRLVSYVVPVHDKRANIPPATTASDFRRYLAERLPGQMVPSAFVIQKAFPLTPNGKIDRSALPPPGNPIGRETVPQVEPRTDLERKLASVWESIFEFRPIGIDDDFFALGGHSLLASRLAATVAREFGQRLALATVIRAPTIRLMSSHLSKPTRRSSSLVEVQPEGPRPPFFCLPGWTGVVDGMGALSLRSLAELLGPDQPMLTFQSKDSGPAVMARSRLEDLAAMFVEDLLDRHPRGPYHLGGYSHGAHLAFEMACQLRAAGHPIGLLALIDMWGVGFPTRLSRLGRLRKLRLAEVRDRILAIAQAPLREINNALGTAAHERDTPSQPFEDMVETYRGSLWKQRFPGQAILFRASYSVAKPGFSFSDPYNGCRTLADEVVVHRVPGDHVTIMRKPNIQALATGLRGHLHAAQSASAAGLLVPCPPRQEGARR
ncbi:amino acid adenylation domain-containing protein [Singulisphaera sp. GP187]|uniref:non-ribosomal peptide synthetase n=1 Tax=Singulisphaera sp. GP187 TaxID=1882752 RepID=UPI0009272E10|nr:amino acid adenylation domain-containing protein [Singulisphaera sp. GP187]SIO66447.1 amino acid adenylation domain-containing protein [Singulisphaera sp. GP187]